MSEIKVEIKQEFDPDDSCLSRGDLVNVEFPKNKAHLPKWIQHGSPPRNGSDDSLSKRSTRSFEDEFYDSPPRARDSPYISRTPSRQGGHNYQLRNHNAGHLSQEKEQCLESSGDERPLQKTTRRTAVVTEHSEAAEQYLPREDRLTQQKRPSNGPSRSSRSSSHGKPIRHRSTDEDSDSDDTYVPLHRSPRRDAERRSPRETSEFADEPLFDMGIVKTEHSPIRNKRAILAEDSPEASERQIPISKVFLPSFRIAKKKRVEPEPEEDSGGGNVADKPPEELAGVEDRSNSVTRLFPTAPPQPQNFRDNKYGMTPEDIQWRPLIWPHTASCLCSVCRPPVERNNTIALEQ